MRNEETYALVAQLGEFRVGNGDGVEVRGEGDYWECEGHEPSRHVGRKAAHGCAGVDVEQVLSRGEGENLWDSVACSWKS